MSTDNRTKINDCEANTGWSGDDTANPISTAGSFIEGSGALSTQLSNADEGMWTTRDTNAAGLIAEDWSDSTLYMNIKDNLMASFSAGGTQFIVGDGTDTIGYFIAGNDAVGMPGQLFFSAYKLDVSVVVASPGTVNVDFHEHVGTEANLAQASATEIGLGTLHLAKAVGSIDNIIMDGFYFHANGSYALTINGGTVGTPETMVDVAGDDVTNGWNLVTNPRGTLYNFFGPTEWGESAAATDHYFTADGEQWFFIGDNSGGHTVGVTHFPFRVIGNGTGTGSFVISAVAIINTGTASEFDCSSTGVETLEIDGCSMSGLASFNAPSSGGTSRFCTNTIFTSCGAVTANGCDMTGCSIFTPNVTANNSGLIWDINQDPNGELDSMTFSKTSGVAHHAIEFGTTIPDGASYTLTGCNFGTDFSATEDGSVGDETFHFLNTNGAESITLNLVGCTGNFGYRTEGVSVTIVADPVTTLVNIQDPDGDGEQFVQVYLEAAGALGDLPYQQSITSITRITTTAYVTFGLSHGLKTGEYLKLDGITSPEADNSGAFQVDVTGATTLTYQTTASVVTPYTTGTTITGTGATIYGETDLNGDISSSRTYTNPQLLVGYARKKDDGTDYFKAIELNGEVSITDGLIINRRLISDGLVNP